MLTQARAAAPENADTASVFSVHAVGWPVLKVTAAPRVSNPVAASRVMRLHFALCVTVEEGGLLPPL